VVAGVVQRMLNSTVMIQQSFSNRCGVLLTPSQTRTVHVAQHVCCHLLTPSLLMTPCTWAALPSYLYALCHLPASARQTAVVSCMKKNDNRGLGLDWFLRQTGLVHR
jgi:hypothetical protein